MPSEKDIREDIRVGDLVRYDLYDFDSLIDEEVITTCYSVVVKVTDKKLNSTTLIGGNHDYHYNLYHVVIPMGSRVDSSDIYHSLTIDDICIVSRYDNNKARTGGRRLNST
jgi:hypothetical protein